MDDKSVEKEVDVKINSVVDVKVNSVVDVEVNDKQRQDDVDSDDESDDESVHVLECHNDKYGEYDSDNESMLAPECRDNKYTEHDLDENVVQSMNERVQSNDVPEDMTDIMVEEYNEKENVTTYVLMSLLNGSGS